MKNPSIIYLWAEVTGYVTGVLEEILRFTSGTVDVVHWDKKDINSTHYKIEDRKRINFFPRSSTSADQIFRLLLERRPDIIVVSGWMDKGYITACRRYKRHTNDVKVVVGIDDQWTGSIRQRVGQLYYALFFRNLFDFMWVSGKPQYSFAQRFGYGIDNILSNLYSADTNTFNCTSDVCKRFVFVGRFVKVKALDLLVTAYTRLPAEKQSQWPLLLIGDGDQLEMILDRKNSNIQVLPFMQPKELKDELRKGGVACLTSHKDNWGVSIHEYALMGMPMLLSSGCGAATEFLIPGYNGYMFKSGDVGSLFEALQKIVELDITDLGCLGQNSEKLGSRINCEISAKSLLSAVYL